MTQGFYTYPYSLFLIIKYHSMNKYEFYEVSNSKTLRSLKYFYFSRQSKLILPFNHYPSFEELQQLSELFI